MSKQHSCSSSEFAQQSVSSLTLVWKLAGARDTDTPPFHLSGSVWRPEHSIRSTRSRFVAEAL
jgi:hypothetical protein